MAERGLCEPTVLYNILNQVLQRSRLSEPNYLCLIGKNPEGHVLDLDAIYCL